MNGLLFDMPAEAKCHDQTNPLMHRGDPATSRQAAERLASSGKLRTQRQGVAPGRLSRLPDREQEMVRWGGLLCADYERRGAAVLRGE